MNDKKSESETKRIEALYGPYAGSQIDIPTADADQAIADGWARDPFAPPAEPSDEPVEYDREAHEKAIEAAEKAARKFRGEDTEDDMKARKPKKADSKVKEDTNADTQAAVGKVRGEQMEADSGKGYETRQTRKPKAD